MDRFGFIHDKLDIKILILYILRRLPGTIGTQALAELVLCDDGISYFDYADCLSDLAETGQVEETSSGYRISEAGDRNCSIIENSLPYTVRKKADRALAPVASDMRRSAMISASSVTNESGSVTVELSMSDGLGEVVSLRILAPDEEKAGAMQAAFKKDAEGIYNEIMQILLR